MHVGVASVLHPISTKVMEATPLATYIYMEGSSFWYFLIINFCLHCWPLQAGELSEAGVKIGMLEKKVESADAETARQVAREREETERIRDIMEEQERWVKPIE